MNLSKYIGKPYEEYNCFDLVKEFYKDQFGITLKNYYEGKIPAPEEVQQLITSNRGDFELVTGKHQFGDLVIIRLYGVECHIGVVADKLKFLHSIRKTGSGLEKLSRYANHIAGIYRHREIPK